MRKGRMTVGTGLAVVAIGLSAVTAGATGGGGPIAESILGSGSDTTQTMMAYLDYGYNIGAGYGDGTFGGCQQLATSPTPQWLDFSCADDTHGNVNRTLTDGVTTSGSATVTSATGGFVSTFDQGRGVEGAGIPAGAYIQAVNSLTSVTLSASAAASATGVTLKIDTIVTDNYRHDQVHGAFFLGSSNGINQLCQAGNPGVAAIDYARSSRAPKVTDCSGLDFVAYALDAISWEAWNIAGSGINNGGAGQNNPSLPCAAHTICLTQAQLKAIYVSCTITNWNQVGGANVPIITYTEQAGSGTRSTFETFLGGSSASCGHAATPTGQIPENSNEGIPVANEKGAIFPFSFGVYSVSVGLNPAGSVLGNIDGVAVTRANIQNSSFPWIRSLYNVYNPATAQAGVGAYVGPDGWICGAQNTHSFSSTGANFHFVVTSKITAAGFVPLLLGPIGGGDPGTDYCRLTVTP
jgi:ABC-type phosphate transport system substrate-binding protein